MEDKPSASPLQKLRTQLGQKLQHLPDYKIIELCTDYGIQYELVDANSLRIFMLLAAAEQCILENTPVS